jgi:hypothetical protein
LGILWAEIYIRVGQEFSLHCKEIGIAGKNSQACVELGLSCGW